VTDIYLEIWAIIAAWIGLTVVLARLTLRSPEGSVGLPLAILFSMSFLYCGFISYAVPGYSHSRADGSRYLQGYDFSEATVLAGVFASLIGVAGFTLGCWLATSRRRVHADRPDWTVLQQVSPAYRSKLMLMFGAFGFSGFVLAHFSYLIDFPMVLAVSQVGRNVATVVICLGAALAVHADQRQSYWGWAAMAVAIPVFYIVAWGFVSSGFIAFTVFAAFWLALLARPGLSAARIAAFSALTVYGMLSLFVAWMTFRDGLRANDDRATSERLDIIVDGFGKTELLSVNNFASLDWLNIRLNQYIFVGKAIEWHQIFPDLQLYGESLYLALFAFVPRALWPGKPAMGGSRFLADHTGMVFSEGTTFGAGPVFEFYANFGYVGDFVGFLVLGYLVRKIDIAASQSLQKGDLFECIRWFTVGLAFNAPLTDFFFFINTAIISWLVMTALKHAIILKAAKLTQLQVSQRP
jgi:hypothetical protein